MTGRHFAAALTIIIALAACADDSYESVSKDIDQLMAEQVPLTAEYQAKIASLREQAEQLNQEGKADESVAALKKARELIEHARDADLIRKSEG
jgi:hypothetical protein